MSLELRKHFEELIPLTDEEFATLASYFNLRKLKKHQYLIQENEPITNIYFEPVSRYYPDSSDR